MKFTHLPVDSHLATTQNFEQLQALLTTALKTLGTLKGVQVGEGSFTFAAGTAIDGVKVFHTLNAVPKFIGITAYYANDGHQCAASLSSTEPPTTERFVFGVRDLSGVANSQTHKFLWIAVA